MRKLSRINLEKARSSSPADRRKTVAELGDSFREIGAVRILVPEGLRFDTGSAKVVGLELLEILDEYFGLGPSTLSSHVALVGSEAATEGPALVTLGVVENGDSLVISSREDRLELSVRSGEWVAFSGPGLASLTRGVVPAAGVEAVGGPTVSLLVELEQGETHLPAFVDP